MSYMKIGGENNYRISVFSKHTSNLIYASQFRYIPDAEILQSNFFIGLVPFITHFQVLSTLKIIFYARSLPAVVVFPTWRKQLHALSDNEATSQIQS